MPKQGERRFTLTLKAKDGREYEYVMEIGTYTPPVPKSSRAPQVQKSVERCWLLRGPKAQSPKGVDGYEVVTLAHAKTANASEVTDLKAKLPALAGAIGVVVPKGALPWKSGIVPPDQPLDSKGAAKPAALPLKPAPDAMLTVEVPDGAIPILQEQMVLSHAVAKNRAAIGEALRQVEEAKAELKERQGVVSELETKESDLFDSMLDCQRDLEHGQTRLVFGAKDKPEAKPKKKAAAKKKAAPKKKAAAKSKK